MFVHDVLVMRCDKGFYTVDAVRDVPIEQQAKDHGELNPHILRVELLGGQVLWEREDALDPVFLD